jgi:hypothetical protein
MQCGTDNHQALRYSNVITTSCCCGLWVPACAGTTAERRVHVTVTPRAAFHLFTRQTARSLDRLPIHRVKLGSSPVLCLGAGVRPTFLSSLPPQSRGMARRKGAVPGLLQAMSGSGRTMVHSGAPAPLGAPTQHLLNAAVRQGHFCALTSSERRLQGKGLRACRPAGAAPVPRSQDAS